MLHTFNPRCEVSHNARRIAFKVLIPFLSILILLSAPFVFSVHKARADEENAKPATGSRVAFASNQQTTTCPISGSLIVGSGDSCDLDPGNYVFHDVMISGTLNIKSDLSSGVGVTITAYTVTVEAGGLINGDGLGFTGGLGPGTGNTSGNFGGGGGHGGLGGLSGNAVGGDSYDSLTEPRFTGSGGVSSNQGGTGGSAVHFVVTHTLDLNSSISMDGVDGKVVSGGWGGGGGSGGAVWIEANNFQGSGKISVNGGKGIINPSGGGGGGAGGRIAIDAEDNSYSGETEAFGGSGNHYGGPGTIYWSQERVLTVDNNSHDSQPAVIGPGSFVLDNLTMTHFGHLIVKGVNSELDLRTAIVTGSITETAKLTIEGRAIASK